MLKVVKLKTGSRFEEIGSYSRVVAVDDWIFVSNTAGRNPRTLLIPEDVTDQTLQVFANIESALEAVGVTLDDVVAARIFIQDPADTYSVMTAVGHKFRGIDPATTVTSPSLGSDEYKVEIEVTAHRGVAQTDAERVVIKL